MSRARFRNGGFQMNAMSLEQTNVESTRWLRFLSRWALVMVLIGIALLTVFIGGIGFAPSDNALGAEYSELLQAVRVPAMYRLFTTFDALGWVMMGGALLSLAVILRSRAPIRALLIAACGMGLLVGVLGGAVRLVGISDLAARYATAALDYYRFQVGEPSEENRSYAVSPHLV